MACLSSNVDAASPRNLRQEFSKIAAFAPMLTSSGLTSMEQILGGSPGGTQTVTWTGRGGKEKSASYTTPATRGFLDLFANDISPAMSAANTAAQSAQRTGDINDVARLGGAGREALRSASPENTALLDEMNRQALEDLRLGGRLNPAQAREVAQSVRAGQSARGMGFGPIDVYQEALQHFDAGERLKDSRRAYAGGVFGANQNFYGDPFMQILGRPSDTTRQAQAFLGQAESPAGQGAAYASDLFNTNFNASSAARLAEASGGAGTLAGLASY